MSIKARLVIVISILVTAAFVLTGVITVRATRAGMIDRVDDTLFAIQAKSGPKQPGDKNDGKSTGNEPPKPDIQTNQPGNTGNSDGVFKRSTASLTFDSEGRVINTSQSGYVDDPDPLPDLASFDIDELRGLTGNVFTAGATTGELEYRILIQNGEQGNLHAVAAPLGDVDATIRNLTIIVGVLGVIVLLTMTGLVWLVIRRSLAPIDSMIETAGLIASGDLSQRVDIDDEHTEVGSLGQALNAMLARVEASFAAKEASERRLRQFVADASHELRTPLTSIRGYAELYRSGAVSNPDDLRRVMGRIESEGTRMGRLVEDLLLLARLDQGRPLLKESVDLAALVGEAVMDARASAPQRPIHYRHDHNAFVTGDADRLRQVVENLLTNASIHTPPDTPVHVEVMTTDDNVVLTVADEGPGVDPDDAGRIFDRFYRADTSRARASGGAGLGLSIAASIIEAHEGTLQLETSTGNGAVFTVTLVPTRSDTNTGDQGSKASR